ncbi:unnamed protein product, partial [Coregonus sp. 'balchen']
DAVINLMFVQDICMVLGFEWTVLAYELSFSRTEVCQFHIKSREKRVQARNMEYERSWDKPNKTKLLQDNVEHAGRCDLAERLRCLHWGHQKLSRSVELPPAFPFLITVHRTIKNQNGIHRINDLSRRFT